MRVGFSGRQRERAPARLAALGRSLHLTGAIMAGYTDHMQRAVRWRFSELRLTCNYSSPVTSKKHPYGTLSAVASQYIILCVMGSVAKGVDEELVFMWGCSSWAWSTCRCPGRI